LPLICLVPAGCWLSFVKVVGKFIAPVFELVMLDKAPRSEFDREEIILRFGGRHGGAR
jgi:hypothetical protein